VTRDPAGLLFCILPDPPGTLHEGNAGSWEKRSLRRGGHRRARRLRRALRLATIVLGALALVLVGLSVPIGIAARQPFDGLALAGVLAPLLGG